MFIDSSDDFINTQDVISAADEFEDSIEWKLDEISNKETELADIDEEDEDEYAAVENELDELNRELDGLKEEAEDIFELRDDIADFADGTLINEDYWAQYVQQQAEDIDGINTSNWPYNCIDWDQAASDLAVDYSIITWRGQDFYIRA
jgi:vacuolar-type H+-ATPase subunit I/STV1